MSDGVLERGLSWGWLAIATQAADFEFMFRGGKAVVSGNCGDELFELFGVDID